MRRILFLLMLLPLCGLSQKKVLDHTVFNEWRKIERSQISPNGNLVVYEINPHQGDGYLYIHNVSKNTTDSILRGKEAQISWLNDIVAFKITPGFDTLRNCELNKIDKKKWPKDSLGIFLIERDTLIKVAKLKSFRFSERSNVLTYMLDDNKLEVTDSGKKKKKKKKDDTKEYKSDGTILAVFDPTTLLSKKMKDVTDYEISENGKYLAAVTHKKEKSDSFRLELYREATILDHTYPMKSAYKQLSFSPEGNLFTYMHSADTSKNKQFQLELFDTQKKTNITVSDTSSSFLPNGKAVSEHFKPSFTSDGRFMYFGIADRVYPEKKDSLLETEKPKLDVWHYLDDRIQSQQLKELKKDEKSTDLFIYHIADGKAVGLSSDTLKVNPVRDLKGQYLFAASDEAYAIANQWDVPSREDHYRISIMDGKVELLHKDVRMDGQLSPSGRYYTWFNHNRNQYFILDTETGKESCITCGSAGVQWQEDVNGMPMAASPYGVAGYTGNERSILIQSSYDLWEYTIDNGALNNFTGNGGSSRKIRMNPVKWNIDSVYLDPSNYYIMGFNEKTKGTHLLLPKDHGDHIDVVEAYYSDHKLMPLMRAKQSERVILRKSSVKDYPELRLTSTTFSEERILTRTNPQQDSFNWASVELINWKSYKGIPLEGLIYKPENYDPTKKYPLLIYYYELYNEDLHNHYVPKPSASIIHPTEYASAGYIVFIPDIRYEAGHPAKSAYDCIMSGTDHVLKLYPSIDPKRLGLQGQSWGGYQTAQLITMTDRYAAAMAGAPVSNMFSAYGGIRWGSGVNRQFQYEKTQSRIGKTIWEAPELYVENSPLFHLPKVKTPLLIMHNDEDGAVPWYQGIELYTGMRRLGKACWMLNYNGDDHNLMKNANRIDLSIRMKQFFDHYLMDAPAPLWMTEGIPAVKKGKELRYETSEN